MIFKETTFTKLLLSRLMDIRFRNLQKKKISPLAKSNSDGRIENFKIQLKL